MNAPTYRPGDIAMVKWDEHEEHIAVAINNGPDCRLTWMSPETHYWTTMPHEVGPALGNVADIAAEARVQTDSRPAETQHNRRSDRDVQEARREALAEVVSRLQPPPPWPATDHDAPDRGYETGWLEALSVVEELHDQEAP